MKRKLNVAFCDELENSNVSSTQITLVQLSATQETHSQVSVDAHLYMNSFLFDQCDEKKLNQPECEEVKQTRIDAERLQSQKIILNANASEYESDTKKRKCSSPHEMERRNTKQNEISIGLVTPQRNVSDSFCLPLNRSETASTLLSSPDSSGSIRSPVILKKATLSKNKTHDGLKLKKSVFTEIGSTSCILSNEESEQLCNNSFPIPVAFGGVSSNKPKRKDYQAGDPHVNEDRIDYSMIDNLFSSPDNKELDNDELKSYNLFFAGVFDGHGGCDKVSDFLSKNLKNEFTSILKKMIEESSINKKDVPPILATPSDESLYQAEADLVPSLKPSCTKQNVHICSDLVSAALEQAFINIDYKFYQKMKEEAAEAKIPTKEDVCKCKWFRENPCRCQDPPISANVGSTATAVVISNDFIVVANVGDSEAYLVVSNPESTSSLYSMEPLTTIDTPVVDDKNIDYARIKKIFEDRKHPNMALSQQFPGKKFINGIIDDAKNPRYNYVSLEGARSLNMVRAFGNYGHKEFDSTTGKCIEDKSPIIVKPHVAQIQRSEEMKYIILGSDGLWDNIPNKNDIINEISKYNRLGVNLSPALPEKLLQMAMLKKIKPDDISVVVIAI